MNNLDVKEIRSKLGVSQKQLAEKIGVSINTIQNWEAGKRIPISKHQILSNLLNDSEDAIPSPAAPLREARVPLIPIEAMAGELAAFDYQGVDARHCDWIISPVPGADFAVPVSGDSMYPDYPNGCKVFVKRINHLDFFVPGDVYVLDTTNGPLLKKVTFSDRDDSVRCISINERDGYVPFDVPKHTIRAMFRVIAMINFR